MAKSKVMDILFIAYVNYIPTVPRCRYVLKIENPCLRPNKCGIISIRLINLSLYINSVALSSYQQKIVLSSHCNHPTRYRT